MSEKKGIKELLEVVDFIAEVGNGAGKSAEDGKLSWTDALHFSKAVMAAPSAIIGIVESYKELLDLDDEERGVVHARLKDKFDIPQDKVEEVVEQILGVVLHFGKAIEIIKELKK